MLSQSLASFEELAELVIAWRPDFRQISRNYFATTIEQAQVEDILYTRLTCGCFATHAGQAPREMYTISVPEAAAPPFRFSGRLIDRPVLLASLPGQEFDVEARPGYWISNFSIPCAILDDYCENNFGCRAERMLETLGRVIPIGPEISANFQSLARHRSALAQTSSHSSRRHHPVQSFESQLLEILFDPLHRQESARMDPKPSSRTRMLERSLEFVRCHQHERLSVHDLCAAVGASERTLQRLFGRELGISPKQYLFGQRMAGARRQLWQSSPSETRVVDVASEWGFWHMGQFAKDYRRFFNELPSRTLNRSGTTQVTPASRLR